MNTSSEELIQLVKDNPDLTVLDYLGMLDRTPRDVPVFGLGSFLRAVEAYNERERQALYQG